MTIKFLASMLVPEVEVIIRGQIGRSTYATFETTTAGSITEGESKFYEAEVEDWFFRPGRLVVTI